MISSDTAVAIARAFAAFGALVGALEYLAIAGQFSGGGLFSWKVFQTKYRVFVSPRLGVVASRCFGARGMAVVHFVKACVCLLLLFPGLPHSIYASGCLSLVVLHCVQQYRTGVGGDGSDQMLVVVMAGLFAYYAFIGDSRFVLAGTAGIVFISAQSVLAYAASGVSKLASPVWRSGDALSLILRTATYGSKFASDKVDNHPVLGRVASWSVIAFELAFPLVFVFPLPVVLGVFVCGALFHAGCAVIMGLNCFFWEFIATYPAIYVCIVLIHSSR